VRAYADYLPSIIPLVHPSPLNFRWQAKNPWFEAEVVPAVRSLVAKAIGA
jgi:uracil-DNA glycosylase